MNRSHSRPGPEKSRLQPRRWLALPAYMVMAGPWSAMVHSTLWASPGLLEEQHWPGPAEGSERIGACNRPAAFYRNTRSDAGRIRNGDDGPMPAQTGGKYIPTVSLHKRECGHRVETEPAGNWCHALERIGHRTFQPLSAPVTTGNGTDLGLCLHCPIIVCVHGRKLPVETITGEKFQFLVILPQQTE